jgi:hypothetical protein
MTDVAGISGAKYPCSLKFPLVDHSGQHSYIMRYRGYLSRLITAWLMVLIAACSSSDNSSVEEGAILYLKTSDSEFVSLLHFTKVIVEYRFPRYWQQECEQHSATFKNAVAFCNSNYQKAPRGENMCQGCIIPLSRDACQLR